MNTPPFSTTGGFLPRSRSGRRTEYSTGREARDLVSYDFGILTLNDRSNWSSTIWQAEALA